MKKEILIQKNEDMLQLIKEKDKQIEQLQVHIVCLTEEHTTYREQEFSRQEERKKIEEGKRDVWLRKAQATYKLAQENLTKAEATIRTLKFEAQRRKREAFENLNKITEDEKRTLKIILSKIEDVLASCGGRNSRKKNQHAHYEVVDSDTDKSEEDVKLEELPERKHIQLLTQESLKNILNNYRSCRETEKKAPEKKYENVYTQVLNSYSNGLRPSPQTNFEIIEKLYEIKDYLILQQERVIQLAASTREQIYDISNNGQKIHGRKRVLTLGKNKSCERQQKPNPPESPKILNCNSCNQLAGSKRTNFCRHIKAYQIKDSILTNSSQTSTRNGKIRTCWEEKNEHTFSQANLSSGPLFSIAEEEEDTQFINEKEESIPHISETILPADHQKQLTFTSPKNSKESSTNPYSGSTATLRMISHIHQEEEKNKQINGSTIYNLKNSQQQDSSKSGLSEESSVPRTKEKHQNKKKIMFCCTTSKSKQLSNKIGQYGY